MKFILNKDSLMIEDEGNFNSGSIKYYEINLEHDETWDNLTIAAIMQKDDEDKGVPVLVIDNKVYIDKMISGKYLVGFVGYRLSYVLTEDEAINPNKKYYTRAGTEGNYVYTLVEHPTAEDISTYYEAEKEYQVSTALKKIKFTKGAGEIELTEEGLPSLSQWEIYLEQIRELIPRIIFPTGGTLGQVLMKLSNEDYDFRWNDISEEDPVFSASAAHDITSEDIANWNNKGTYNKPNTGIPKTDLASSVQSSLAKADSALQEHQDISGKQNKLTSQNAGQNVTITEVDGVVKINSTGGGGEGTSNHAYLDNLDYEHSGHTGFQAEIDDLDDIRSGAGAGATAVQDNDYVHTDNNYTTNEKNKLAGLSNYDDTALSNRVANAEDDIDDLKTTVAGHTTAIGNKQDKLTSANAGTNVTITEVDGVMKINSTGGSGDSPVSGGSNYLGIVDNYTSQGTALNLNDLDVGTYYVYKKDTSNQTLYIKATYKGADLYWGLSISSGIIPSTAIIFKINQKVTDDLAENIEFLNVYDLYIDKNYNGGLLFNIYSIKITNNQLNVSSTYSTLYDNYLSTNKNQTITGIKTFNTLPESSVVPTSDTQLVNKKYVDDTASGGGGGTSNHSQLINLDYANSGHTGFQQALISGTNIKTINNQSILGSGNITIQGGSGGLSNLTDGTATGSLKGIEAYDDSEHGLLGQYAMATGYCTVASGDHSHAEGLYTVASGYCSHAEGEYTVASGFCSLAEGAGTNASEFYSHAEGSDTNASGYCSHAEGSGTVASGYCSHAEGSGTVASGFCSHAEGSYTNASGYYSHAEGSDTNASGSSQHVEGRGNIEDTNNEYAHIIGNGELEWNDTTESYEGYSNAHTVDWQGNAWYAGDVYVGSTSGTNKDAGSKKLATEDYVDSLIGDIETLLGGI